MARVRKDGASADKQATDAAVAAEVDELVQKPAHQAGSKEAKPYSIEPKFGRNFDRIVEIVFDPSVDVVAEYEELEAALEIEQALTPQVVRAELNKAEKRAFNAHRLYVMAKLELERYEIDVGVAIGAMRDRAIAKLGKEKKDGERAKQITEADVAGECAVMFPDEWRQVNNQREAAKRSVDLMKVLAEQWAKRSYSLSAMLGGNRN